MKCLILCALVALCWAEAPLSGPYAPSGWKPSGAEFNLPTEYGVPAAEQQAKASEIEISNENVEYAGQFGETATAANPQTAYLPPSGSNDPSTDFPVEPQEDLLRVQGLPTQGHATFNNNELNTGEIAQKRADIRQFQQVRGSFIQTPQAQQQQFRGQLRQATQQQQQFRQGLPQKEAQQFRPAFNQASNPQQQQFNGNFRQASQSQQQQQQQFRGNFKQTTQPQQQQQFRGNFRQAPQSQKQQQQFLGNFRQQQQFSGQLRQASQPLTPRQTEFAEFIPNTQARFNNAGQNGRLQQQFGRQVEQPAEANGVPAQEYGTPAQQYGPPAQEYGPPEQQPERAEEPQQPEDNNVQSELPQAPEQEQVESVEETDEPSVAISNASNGQYYILAPDNTLQKVIFMTSQTEDDRRNKGFTAQLRYSPVAPIRDPIYAYNEQGQLVRIYNKKK